MALKFASWGRYRFCFGGTVCRRFPGDPSGVKNLTRPPSLAARVHSTCTIMTISFPSECTRTLGCVYGAIYTPWYNLFHRLFCRIIPPQNSGPPMNISTRSLRCSCSHPFLCASDGTKGLPQEAETVNYVNLSGEDSSKKRSDGTEDQTNSALFAVTALSLFGLSFKKEEVDEVVVLIHKARIAQEEMKLLEADKLYHEALFRLIERFKIKQIDEKTLLERRTLIMNGLANNALIRGMLGPAEALFKETMKGMLLCGVGKTDNSMVEISLKLANVYAIQGRDVEAREGYLFCIQSQATKLEGGYEDGSDSLDPDTVALYGLSLDNFARYLISKEEYSEAEGHLKKALKVAQALSVSGEDVDQTKLILMNNLATLFSARNDHDNAEEYMAKVLKVAEERKYPQLASYYCNLGMMFFRKGQLSDAAELCEKSKKLAHAQNDSETEKKAAFCLKRVKMNKGDGIASV